MSGLYSTPKVSKTKQKGFTEEWLCSGCNNTFYMKDDTPGGLWRMHEYGNCPHCGGKDFWIN